MTAFMKKVSSVLKSDSGTVAVEYGLLASLVGIALIAGATMLGTDLSLSFKAIAGKLTTTIQ